MTRVRGLTSEAHSTSTNHFLEDRRVVVLGRGAPHIRSAVEEGLQARGAVVLAEGEVAGGIDGVVAVASFMPDAISVVSVMAEIGGLITATEVCLEQLAGSRRADLAAVFVVPEVGIAGVPGTAAIASGAGAVLAASRALAVEWAASIRVNSVAYGAIEDDEYSEWFRAADPTGLIALDGSPTLLQRCGVARDVANAVCFLISARASFVHGHTLVVDGGYLVR